MEMLELRDLHKTFNPGTVNEKVALNGVSLTMEAGDFATIVGSNGAGKSTLFNAITGAIGIHRFHWKTRNSQRFVTGNRQPRTIRAHANDYRRSQSIAQPRNRLFIDIRILNLLYNILRNLAIARIAIIERHQTLRNQR